MGTINDGYIGSNKQLLRAYKKRKNDFKRRIIFWFIGEDHKKLYKEEQHWLNMIKWDELNTTENNRNKTTRYYNQKLKASGIDSQTMKKWHASKAGQIHKENIVQKINEWLQTDAGIAYLHKVKNSKHNLGHKHTKEHCQRLSILRKGRKYRKIACPHCGKIGGVNNMKQWHFNKCKYIIINN